MIIYIALLRGINVGKHNRIKMAELKKLVESIGLHNVKTYIQSGNVLFESEEEGSQISQRIEQEIKTIFGFSVTVVVRTAKEFEQIIRKCPYQEDRLLEGESIHVALLADKPSEEKINILRNFKSEMDECHIEDKEIYLYLRQSILDSKLAVQLQKVGVPATVRNWKTMNKVSAIAMEMG